MSPYLQKKIIITGQNDAEGKIYVTDYKEELPEDIVNNSSNKVNIDDDDVVGQVANIKSVFGSSRTDQAPTEAEAPAPAPAPAPAAPAADVTTTASAQPPITIEQFNAMQIPWRDEEHYSNTNVSDYIPWINTQRRKNNIRDENVKELVRNIVEEYNRLIEKGSITKDELTSFFKLTENLKQMGGKTKKLRAFRKKTLRNQRKSKKRLGSRKNIR